MKRRSFAALFAAVAALPTVAAVRQEQAAHTVTVCTEALPESNYLKARGQASLIFAMIGIGLKWRISAPCPQDALRVTLSSGAPATVQPGALAYALPYEGTHIVVFIDRISRVVPDDKLPTVLGYVLAHEITHILQGVSRHSESGIMKAHWGPGDFASMNGFRLCFTKADISLIYDGLAQRRRNLTTWRQITEDRTIGNSETHE